MLPLRLACCVTLLSSCSICTILPYHQCHPALSGAAVALVVILTAVAGPCSFHGELLLFLAYLISTQLPNTVASSGVLLPCTPYSAIVQSTHPHASRTHPCIWMQAYLISPKSCHAFVGYLEEEAVKTYTHAIHDVGKLPTWSHIQVRGLLAAPAAGCRRVPAMWSNSWMPLSVVGWLTWSSARAAAACVSMVHCSSLPTAAHGSFPCCSADSF